MQICITGATGAMGYYLVQFIRQTTGYDHRIYGIGRKRLDSLLYFDQYDALNLYWEPTNRITQYINEVKPDVVFHLAAMANVRASFDEPRSVVSNNVDGTLNLLEGIARSNVRPLIVHCSTSEVYGNVPMSRNPIVESEPFAPVNFYACSKTMQELVCGTYEKVHGLRIVITRAFGYINPRRSDLVATSIARQIVRYESGIATKIYHGNLLPIRSFCDARDIAEAYWRAMRCCEPGVYNIGSETPTSIRELLLLLEAASGHENLPLVKEESLLRPTDIFACWPNVTKFRMMTRWQPRRSLGESLKWLMESVRQDKN